MNEFLPAVSKGAAVENLQTALRRLDEAVDYDGEEISEVNAWCDHVLETLADVRLYYTVHVVTCGQDARMRDLLGYLEQATVEMALQDLGSDFQTHMNAVLDLLGKLTARFGILINANGETNGEIGNN